MSVDMFPYKFIKELNKLAVFTPAASWDIDRDRLPSVRAIFTSTLLFGHSSGYRLPSYAYFENQLKRAYRDERHEGKLVPLFEGEKLREMTDRMRVFYESGMVETYVYTCLVFALEDKSKCGFVAYDYRLDIKHKWDALVLVGKHSFWIDVYRGTESSRSETVRWREENERETKKNTAESSHWDHQGRSDVIKLRIMVSDKQQRVVKGVRLPTIESVNALLTEIYNAAGVEDGYLLETEDYRAGC